MSGRVISKIGYQGIRRNSFLHNQCGDYIATTATYNSVCCKVLNARIWKGIASVAERLFASP
jgi:hypothetical protein